MRNVYACCRPKDRRPHSILAAVTLAVVLYLLACLVETVKWLGHCRISLAVWSAVTGIFGYMVVGQGVLAGLAILPPPDTLCHFDATGHGDT